MSAFHREQGPSEGVHVLHNWAYANAAARTGATGFTASDLYKIALQEDLNSLWMLTAITPTWIEISGSSSVAAFTDLSDVPASYVGAGLYGVRVNAGETGLEFAPVAAGDHEIEDAVTAAVTSVVTWSHNSTGTPAAGFGTGLTVEAETNTTPNTQIGALAWKWENATHASRQSSFNIYTQYGAYSNLSGVIRASYVNIPGNARGIGAVDLQTSRDGVAQVAAGPYSAIIGGVRNTIDTLSDYVGILAGSTNTIQSNADGAVILGGHYNLVDGADYSAIIASQDGRANKWGQVVMAGDSFTSLVRGEAQTSFFTVRRSVTHTGANWYELFLRASTSTRLTLESNRAMTFKALLVGATAGLTKVFGFEITGVIENDGGTTTLLNQTVTTLYDADDTDFDARARGDNTNDALVIEVSDSSSGGDVVRWHGTIIASEIIFN